MKTQRIPLFAISLLLLFGLSACGNPAKMAEPGPSAPPEASLPLPDAPASPESEGEPAPDHPHALSAGGNIVEHDPVGYCGNTVTKISGETRPGEPWEVSFDGGDSVALTDLLLYLDYSDELCKCLPEYRVDTEFGTEYGVNLTEGYARHGGGQVSLTAEQIETIRGILDRKVG